MRKPLYYFALIFFAFLLQTNPSSAQSYDWMLENDTSEQFQNEMKRMMKKKSMNLKRNLYISTYCYNKSVSTLNNVDFEASSIDDLNEIQANIMIYVDILKVHLDRIEEEDISSNKQQITNYYWMRFFNYFASGEVEKSDVYKEKLLVQNKDLPKFEEISY